MATTGLYSQHLNNRKKLHARNAVIALLLVLFAVLALFPIFYMIMSSFGPAIATAGNTRSIFPSKWTLDSYKAFFDFSKYSGRWILNSLIVATATVVGNVIFASMAGYAFSKINFKGRKWMFAMILVAMMIPYQVTQVPLYILIANKLKMTNTYAALILPGVVTSYNIFLAKQFFTSIPTPLIESAKLDGIGYFGELTRIVLPLMWPTLSVIVLLAVVGIFTADGPILLMTQGQYETYTLGYWFYDKTIVNPNLNYGAAVGICFTLVSIPLTLFARWLVNRIDVDVEF